MPANGKEHCHFLLMDRIMVSATAPAPGMTRPLRVGAVGSIGDCAMGKIATKLLFSHRNDAWLVLTRTQSAAAAQNGDSPGHGHPAGTNQNPDKMQGNV